ncbi:coatomer subunit beta' [Nematocida ausubeli]|nr:coatomer subunit beta' [Nematocida ausubeli]
MKDRIAGRFEKARVKQVVSHRKEPLSLVVLYNGEFEMWNTISMSMIKSGSIGEIPIRAAAFIEDSECFAIGSDDGIVRIYCIDTFKLKCQVTAHTDFIRYIAVHPVLPYLATASDDTTIKIWDYSQDIILIKTLSGHTHFVMGLDFSSKDNKILYSCSLDHAIIAWNIETGVPIKTLSKATKTGLNAVMAVTDKYIIGAGDDGKIHVWDASAYTLITSVSGHTGPVTSITQTPHGFITAGEDGLVKEWSTKRFRPETVTPATVQRVWSTATTRSGDILAGGDSGIAFIKHAQSRTLYAFTARDKIDGRVILAENTQITQIKLSAPNNPRVVSSLSFLPDRVSISESGRYVSVESDGTVSVYTVLGFLLQISVPGTSLVWTGPESFLVVHAGNLVVYTDFEMDRTISVPGVRAVSAEGVFKTEYFIRSAAEESDPVSRIISVSQTDTTAVDILDLPGSIGVHKYKSVYAVFYPERVDIVLADGSVISTLSCKVVSWCTQENLLFIQTGGQVIYAIITLPKKDNFQKAANKMHAIALMGVTGTLLGACGDGLWYLIKESGRICMEDIPREVITWQEGILLGEKRPVPEGRLRECIHFLVSLHMLEEAYALADDADEKFELLIQMGRLEEAEGLADTEAKCTRMSSLFARAGRVEAALRCAQKGGSPEDEVLLACLAGSSKDISTAAHRAAAAGKSLVALAGAYRAEQFDLCQKILAGTEFAKLFARTHTSSQGTQAQPSTNE